MNIRDWLYVEDHCAGVDVVLRRGVPGESYNLGAGQERTNLALTRLILKLVGKSEELIQYVTDRPGHDWRYSVDSSKARALGWEPKVDAEEGLRRTVAWYQENQAWWREIKDGSYREYYRRTYAGR